MSYTCRRIISFLRTGCKDKQITRQGKAMPSSHRGHINQIQNRIGCCSPMFVDSIMVDNLATHGSKRANLELLYLLFPISLPICFAAWGAAKCTNTCMEKILYLATPYFTSMEAFPASNPRVEIHLFGDKETVWKVKKNIQHKVVPCFLHMKPQLYCFFFT
jgi:hypothetical protein